MFAAPSERVSVGRDRRAQVVARPSLEEATPADPFGGGFGTQMMPIRLRDGSWLRVDSEEARGQLHLHTPRHAA